MAEHRAAGEHTGFEFLRRIETARIFVLPLLRPGKGHGWRQARGAEIPIAGEAAGKLDAIRIRLAVTGEAKLRIDGGIGRKAAEDDMGRDGHTDIGAAADAFRSLPDGEDTAGLEARRLISSEQAQDNAAAQPVVDADHGVDERAFAVVEIATALDPAVFAVNPGVP